MRGSVAMAGRPSVAGARMSRRQSFSHRMQDLAGLEPEEEMTTQQEEVAKDAMFVDAEAMKQTIRRNLLKEPYDVAKYYKEYGLWRNIATSPIFEKLTLFVIGVNAIWIGIDTDCNSASMLLEAHPVFQIAEHFFCAYFSFEWTCRFMSFKRKRSGLKDAWFVFDSILVVMMVLETWMLSLIILMIGSSGAGGLGNASVLRMARLARLTRMARMARLLRAMPELMILIKGLVAATRSVFFTLCLLGILLYVFAIAFKQLCVGTEVGEVFFVDVATSMYTLLVCGTLMDNIGVPLEMLGEEHFIFGSLYMLYVLLATVTVMNMLIGVLCEVVTTVAAVEKEALTVSFVKAKLEKVIKLIDEDGNGMISKEEFAKIMESKELVRALNEVGVDVEGITGFADFIFVDEEDASQEKELTTEEFLMHVLQFRGTNNATVKDIIDLHKFMKKKIEQTTQDLRELKALVVPLKELLLGEQSGLGDAEMRALAQCGKLWQSEPAHGSKVRRMSAPGSQECGKNVFSAMSGSPPRFFSEAQTAMSSEASHWPSSNQEAPDEAVHLMEVLQQQQQRCYGSSAAAPVAIPEGLAKPVQIQSSADEAAGRAPGAPAIRAPEPADIPGLPFGGLPRSVQVPARTQASPNAQPQATNGYSPGPPLPGAAQSLSPAPLLPAAYHNAQQALVARGSPTAPGQVRREPFVAGGPEPAALARSAPHAPMPPAAPHAPMPPAPRWQVLPAEHLAGRSEEDQGFPLPRSVLPQRPNNLQQALCST